MMSPRSQRAHWHVMNACGDVARERMTGEGADDSYSFGYVQIRFSRCSGCFSCFRLLKFLGSFSAPYTKPQNTHRADAQHARSATAVA
eukprot:720983-Pleurochrysis_carterae.AAC.1